MGRLLGAGNRPELGTEHLDRDEPVVLEVAREPDCGHAVAAELTLERVAVTQGGRELSGHHGMAGPVGVPSDLHASAPAGQHAGAGSLPYAGDEAFDQSGLVGAGRPGGIRSARE